MTTLPAPDQAKAMAKRLRAALADTGAEVTHSATLELLAKSYGLKDWNTLSAVSPESQPSRNRVVPILRMFDWDKAQEFYLGYLGWTVDWVHRFEDHLPLYAQLSSSDGARLHLSEHHGDGTPGAAVIIEIDDAATLHAELVAKDYRFARPGLETEPRGLTITVHDPFGNRLMFMESTHERASDDRVLPPIVVEVRVPLSPDDAYGLFTSFSWWVEYGREVGAAVRVSDEVVFDNLAGPSSIGRVLHQNRPTHWAQTFTLAQDPAAPTRIDVHFRADGDGTKVRLEHGGWDVRNGERRAHFTDWPIILGHFERAARP